MTFKVDHAAFTAAVHADAKCTAAHGLSEDTLRHVWSKGYREYNGKPVAAIGGPRPAVARVRWLLETEPQWVTTVQEEAAALAAYRAASASKATQEQEQEHPRLVRRLQGHRGCDRGEI